VSAAYGHLYRSYYYDIGLRRKEDASTILEARARRT